MSTGFAVRDYAEANGIHKNGVMDYQKADAILQGRNYRSKKLQNNTYLERIAGNAIAVRLHNTHIITLYDDNTAMLDSGGWRTATTKDRLNQYGFHVRQENSEWFYSGITGNMFAPSLFVDGMIVSTEDGTIISDMPQQDILEKRKKLKERIKKYAKLCGSNVPGLPEPSSADCWFCVMTDEKGNSMGDAFNDTNHLESHMDEKYVVPALVYNAMVEAGAGSIFFQTVFTDKPSFLNENTIGEFVTRWVRKYMYRRFNFAS